MEKAEKLEEGDLVTLTFDAVAPRGDAIATTDDLPVYAAGVIPGETVTVRIRKRRRRWIASDVERIDEPSPSRVEPRCPLFAKCSGCQFQHVAYPRQLELKHEIVQRELERTGGFTDAPIAEPIAAASPWYYRNHGRFTVDEGRLGFVRRFRRQWFEVEHCFLMDTAINEVLDKCAGRLDGASQCNVRVGVKERMIQPALDIDFPSGQPHLVEELGGREFRVSASSFFQVHRAQAERLVELVRDAVVPGPDRVLVDAYAGVGTFAALLAPNVGRVIAIEASGPAFRDAQTNIEGLPNVELLEGKTEELLPKIEGRVDAVILDPPRSGCQQSALAALISLAPTRIVYVSCDPPSLARDLRVLVDAGYTLELIQPLDMFPQTHHVECVATLYR